LFLLGLKTKIQGTKLGAVWWILDPLILMGVYYFVIGVVLKRGGPGYPFFVLAGVVVWQTLSKSLTQMTNAFQSNRQLIMSFSAPLSIYVIAPVLVNLFLFLLGLLVVMCFKLNVIGLVTLELIPLSILFMCFLIAVGLPLACINVHIPDTNLIVNYVLKVAFFATPVLYEVSRITESHVIPQWFKTIYVVNPIVFFINGFRDILLYGRGVSLHDALLNCIVVVIILELSWQFFKRSRNNLPKMI